MVSSLDIDRQKMQSIKYASAHTGYSRDHVTKLAREGKIVAAQIGRNWFVDVVSLEHYVTSVEIEQKFRQQRLSEERKRERLLREAADKKERARQRPIITLPTKIGLCAVIVCGFVTGCVLEFWQLGIVTQDNRLVASAQLGHEMPGNNIAVASGVGTEVSAKSVHFSQDAFHLSTLSDLSQGVLILPSTTTSRALDPTELFSDEVEVLTGEDGVEFVARVNASGEVVEKIPFVVVPVNNKTP